MELTEDELSYYELRDEISLNELKIIRDHLAKNNLWESYFQEYYPLKTREDLTGPNYNIALKHDDLNRDKTAIPSNQHRVILGEPFSEYYINASHVLNVTEKKQGKYYFCTQRPDENTSTTFWTMVFQYKCKTVIDLNDWQSREYEYCPDDKNYVSAGNYTIYKNDTFNPVIDSNYSVRQITINSKYEGSHHLVMINFKIDYDNPKGFCKLMRLSREHKLYDDHSPTVVVNSNGSGECGVFILTDCLIQSYEQKENKSLPSISKLCEKLRSQRVNLISSPAQIQLTFNATIHYLEDLIKRKNKHFNEEDFRIVTARPLRGPMRTNQGHDSSQMNKIHKPSLKALTEQIDANIESDDVVEIPANLLPGAVLGTKQGNYKINKLELVLEFND